ncbi:hypothetical protein ACFY3U_11815 [Micromonospora sp. NPDC000089]
MNSERLLRRGRGEPSSALGQVGALGLSAAVAERDRIGAHRAPVTPSALSTLEGRLRRALAVRAPRLRVFLLAAVLLLPLMLVTTFADR